MLVPILLVKNNKKSKHGKLVIKASTADKKAGKTVFHAAADKPGKKRE